MTSGPIITSTNAIIKAQELLGSERALAKVIGVSRQNIGYWKYHTFPPCDKAIEIYVATGGAVSLSELRPDLIGLMKKYKALLFKELSEKE